MLQQPDFLIVVSGFRDSLSAGDRLANCPNCSLPISPENVLSRRYLADRLQSMIVQCGCQAVVEIYPGSED